VKIAVCLVGHANSFFLKKVHGPILKMVEDLNADVYVCTSTLLTGKGGQISQQALADFKKKSKCKKLYIPPRKGCSIKGDHYGWGTNIDSSLLKAYLKEKIKFNLMGIKILDQDIKALNSTLPSHLWQYQRQAELLKLKECFNMIEEHEIVSKTKYDAVIKCRLDLCLINPDQSNIIVKFVEDVIEKKQKCIVNLGGWPCPRSHNDRAFFYGFFYGDRKSMKKVADIIKLEDVKAYTDLILSKEQPLCRGSYLEPIVSHHLAKNDIEIKYEVSASSRKKSRKYQIIRELPNPEKFKI